MSKLRFQLKQSFIIFFTYILIQLSVCSFVHSLIHLFPMYKAPCWLLGANRWRHLGPKFNNPMEPLLQRTSKQGVSKQWHVLSTSRKWRAMQEHRSKSTYIYSGWKVMWEVLYWRQAVFQVYTWKENSFLAWKYLGSSEKHVFFYAGEDRCFCPPRKTRHPFSEGWK